MFLFYSLVPILLKVCFGYLDIWNTEFPLGIIMKALSQQCTPATSSCISTVLLCTVVGGVTMVITFQNIGGIFSYKIKYKGVSGNDFEVSHFIEGYSTYTLLWAEGKTRVTYRLICCKWEKKKRKRVKQQMATKPNPLLKFLQHSAHHLGQKLFPVPTSQHLSPRDCTRILACSLSRSLSLFLSTHTWTITPPQSITIPLQISTTIYSSASPPQSNWPSAFSFFFLLSIRRASLSFQNLHHYILFGLMSTLSLTNSISPINLKDNEEIDERLP